MNRKLPAIAASACLLLALCGCGAQTQVNEATQTNESGNAAQTLVSSTVHEYKSADSDTSAEGAQTLDLSAQTDSVCKITAGGTYLLTGSFDGQLVVQTNDSEKVHLILSDASISCQTGPAIYVLSTDKLILTLVDGTMNTISDGTGYEQDAEGADAALYSKSDVSINGGGSLQVNGNSAHGIVSKDELVITGGAVSVTAVKDALRGKDCVAVSGGTLELTAGSDGIYASETDAGKGYISVDGGSITVSAENDALQAENALCIQAGTVTVTCGGGSETVTLASDAAGFGRSMWNNSQITETDTDSHKGLKSGGTLTVSGGTINLDTADDAIHAAGTLTLSGGAFTLKSGDDAIHSDADVVIDGGTYEIPYCYEGVEGLCVTVNDGTLNIVSSDDGFNAAGGTDSSGFGGGWQDNTFAVQDGCDITVNGGTITVVSDGDSLDSNGNLTLNGGVLNLTCNGNGNTAIDCNGTYTNNADVTTNDGSESGSGMGGGFGGGMGGHTQPGGGMGGMGGGQTPPNGQNGQTPPDAENGDTSGAAISGGDA